MDAFLRGDVEGKMGSSSSSFNCHNAVWLEIEKKVLDKNEEVLRWSLVGRWRNFLTNLPTWDPIGMGSVQLGVERKASHGSFRKTPFSFWVWRPKGSWESVLLWGEVFLWKKSQTQPFCWVSFRGKEVCEVWVRILGLALHLWGKGLFKRLRAEF